jgi:predicted metal-dependent HD superfamily phosphohydrolase
MASAPSPSSSGNRSQRSSPSFFTMQFMTLDNEAKSAAKMKEQLKSVIDPNILETAALTIFATKGHVATPSGDINIVIDLDMAILGQPWARYALYATGIMKEYLSVYGEPFYRHSRSEFFLKPIIAKGKIFLSEQYAQLNKTAMLNMRRENDILTTSASSIICSSAWR